MELIEYWYLLLRRKWIILLSLIIFTSLGVLYAKKSTPIYQSNAKLLFVEDDGLSGMSDLGGMGDLMLSSIGKKSDPLMTQIEMMKTRPVLQQTIDSLKLSHNDTVAYTTDNLKGMLGFSVITNTNLIQITCKGSNSTRNAEILNTISYIYMNVNRNINKESATAARNFIDEQLKSQKVKLDKAEDNLAQYKKKTGMISLEQETTLKIGGIAQLETELIKVEAELQGMKSEVASYKSKISVPGARNSSRYTQWKAAYEEANRKYSTIKAYRTRLKRKVRSENKILNELPEKEIIFANLLRESEIAKQIYASLLENSEQFKIREASNTSNIKMVEPAIPTIDPIAPQKKKIVMLALIAGFMVGFGIALLLEYLDDSPRSVDEIKKILPYETLGSIPYFNKLSQFYTKDNSDSFASESMRLVHTNLKFSELTKSDHKAIMLTSAQPGEGKTTTSINLAYTYAELGSKTAVVNLDLRRPSFHKLIKDTFDKGVTDFLIGEANIEEIKYNTSNNLTVIPAGTVPPNPTVLIGTDKMTELIESLQKSFDVVIFDTPPITLVAETLDLARHMNGIILVTDIADSSLRSIKNMQTLLEGKELPILGTVINKIGKGNSRYYSTYGYSAYHKS